VVGAAIAYLQGGGLGAFLLVWVVGELLGQAALLAMGWRELARGGFSSTEIMGTPLRGLTRRHPGLWRFVWTTNLNSSLRLSTAGADTLIVGAVLGAAAAGLYKVAKQSARVIVQVADPLYYAAYPELAKLWARGEAQGMRRLTVRAGASCGAVALAIWIGFLLAGPVFLRAAFGPGFVDAQGVLVWYMVGIIFNVATLPVHPVLHAAGRPGLHLAVNLVGLGLYLPALTALARVGGLVGAGVAYALYVSVRSVALAGCAAMLLREPPAASALGARAVAAGNVPT